MEHSEDCNCEEHDAIVKKQLESMGLPPEEIVVFMAFKSESEDLFQKLGKSTMLSDGSKLSLLSGFTVTALRILRSSTGDNFPFALMNILKSLEGEALQVFYGKEPATVKPEEMH